MFLLKIYKKKTFYLNNSRSYTITTIFITFLSSFFDWPILINSSFAENSQLSTQLSFYMSLDTFLKTAFFISIFIHEKKFLNKKVENVMLLIFDKSLIAFNILANSMPLFLRFKLTLFSSVKKKSMRGTKLLGYWS